jgi:CrcB protein
MESILFIALGGALGALGRFWTGLAASCLFGSRFPAGTLIVNVAGSFLIGLTASAIAAGRLAPSPWDDLVMQGFCGALTTFSTFSMDSFRLFREGRMGSAWTNLVISMALCLGAAALGLSLFSAETLPAAPVHP